ncbi:MAG: UDP-N-acetylmuramoyl-tripeptide--D-alanyl-D-alanine ligase [Desulfobacteraceae bacterium]|nr:MAG: UDP-N-acetylmuramoyl-tripeptide--D-alanyl-D-alanine ligase [Desulfobacteraceae bacterium]
MKGHTTWKTSDLLQATGGRLVCGHRHAAFSQVSTDSRSILPGELFVAICGSSHDGHTYIKEVIGKGIRGLIVDSDKVSGLPEALLTDTETTCVAVSGTTRALGDMARYYRQRFPVMLAAVTGSTGKTTTREMTASVVAQRFKTLSSKKNFNNEIGLPLTLFRLTPQIQWAVVELGMNHPGEISRLAEICIPDIGLITNVGPVHLEGVGSIEGVMRAKGELLGKIQASGTAVLNADDPYGRQLARAADRKVFFFGESPDADVRAESIRPEGRSVSFSLLLPAETVSVRLRVPGRFMVSNALAAAAVGFLAGLNGSEIKAGLEAFEPVEGRMCIRETENGIRIIDDTYNANPEAMKAAIRVLCSLKEENRGVLVMGDMLELGDRSESLHESIGSEAAAAGVDRLCITGSFSDAVRAGASAAGMPSENIFIGTPDQIMEQLTARTLAKGDWVLVKGSRAMGMEAIVKALMVWGKQSRMGRA